MPPRTAKDCVPTVAISQPPCTTFSIPSVHSIKSMLNVDSEITVQRKIPKYQKIFAIAGWSTIETNWEPSTFVPATTAKKTKLSFGLERSLYKQSQNINIRNISIGKRIAYAMILM